MSVASMHHFCRNLPRPWFLLGVSCLSGALLGAAMPASAAADTVSNENRLIDIKVERQSEATSYTGLGSYNFVSFKVTVANIGGNVVNNISVRLNSRVLLEPANNGDTANWLENGSLLTAPFDSASSTACTKVDTTTVNCAIGQLRASGQTGSSATYILFFASPTRTVAGDAEEVNVQWQASYADASNGQRVDSGSGIANAPIALAPFGTLTNEFKSAVPLAGATLSTGSVDGDGLPQPVVDPWTTTVKVPGAVADYKQARGTEKTDGLITSSDLLDRRITELVIPDTNFQPNKIIITLRRDLSTIRKGSKITNSVIYYTKTLDFDPSTAPDRAPVPFCSQISSNGPYLDSAGAWRPCIRSRTSVPNKKVVSGKSEGYWEWVIEAFENGRYEN